MQVNQIRWNRALALLKLATDAKSSLDGIDEIKVEAENSTCTLTGCDMSVFAEIRIPCEGHFPATTFNLRSLTLLTKAAKSAEIERVASADGAKVGIGKRTFEIPTGKLAPADRPAWPAINPNVSQTWDKSRFLSALEYVRHAMSHDESRFHLNGLYLGDDVCVATDGHRLHAVTEIASFDGFPVIVPEKAVNLLRAAIKACDPAWVAARAHNKGKWVEMSIEGVMLNAAISFRIVDGEFPPWRQIVPNHADRFVLDADALRDCLKTVIQAIKADPTGNGIRMGAKFTANGDLRVATDNFAEVVPLEISSNDKYTWGMSPGYLIDAISGADTVQIEPGNALEPVKIITGDDRFAVVMPTKLVADPK